MYSFITLADHSSPFCIKPINKNSLELKKKADLRVSWANTILNLELDLELDILQRGKVKDEYAHYSSCEWPTNRLTFSEALIISN